MKFLLTIFATILLLLHQFTAVRGGETRVRGSQEQRLTGAARDHDTVGVQTMGQNSLRATEAGKSGVKVPV